MIKVRELKKGSILSEHSYFKVVDITPTDVILKDENGIVSEIGKAYVEKVLTSADIFSKTENKTRTELADLVMKNPRVVMTVCYIKADQKKTKSQFEAEKRAKIDEISKASVKNLAKLLDDLIENPITNIIPGEVRTMKGRHYGQMNEFGRIMFIDMEETRSTGPKQIDPRTIQYIILDDVKYISK